MFPLGQRSARFLLYYSVTPKDPLESWDPGMLIMPWRPEGTRVGKFRCIVDGLFVGDMLAFRETCIWAGARGRRRVDLHKANPLTIQALPVLPTCQLLPIQTFHF